MLVILLMMEILHYLIRSLNYGNYGIYSLLIMGNAGFIYVFISSSTVSPVFRRAPTRFSWRSLRPQGPGDPGAVGLPGVKAFGILGLWGFGNLGLIGFRKFRAYRVSEFWGL